jgi:putative transposase
MVYVAFVIDAFSRRITGWRAATTMTTALVLDALEHTLWTRARDGVTGLAGLVHHNDAGRQHLDRVHRTAYAGWGRSLSRVGRRRLRQCPGRDHDRPVQDRTDPR